MYLTEKEYQKKICQQRHAALLAATLANPGLAGVDCLDLKLTQASMCQASECANWRWEHSDDRAESTLTKSKSKERRGFCGLAGPVA